MVLHDVGTIPDLRLCQRDLELPFPILGGDHRRRVDQDLAPTQPSSGVDNHPAHLPCAVIEQEVANRSKDPILGTDLEAFER